MIFGQRGKHLTYLTSQCHRGLANARSACLVCLWRGIKTEMSRNIEPTLKAALEIITDFNCTYWFKQPAKETAL